VRGHEFIAAQDSFVNAKSTLARAGIPTKVLDGAVHYAMPDRLPKNDKVTWKGGKTKSFESLKWALSPTSGNVLELSGRMWRELDALKLGGYGGWEAVETLYHESAHKVLSHQSATWRQRGMDAYKGATTESGASAGNNRRAFDEACGDYVGQMAQARYRALDSLEFGRQNGLLKPGGAFLASVEKQYNEAMAKESFGYAVVDGERQEIATKMPAWLRNDLNQIIFDGNVPKRFDQVPEFQEYRQEAAEATPKK
jgi:hypothetical protein